MTAVFQRVRVRVVRAGPYTAHVAVPSFAAGQILVPAQTFDLMSATGLTREQLSGADLLAVANVAATTDTDVHLHGWQTPAADERPTVPRPATPPDHRSCPTGPESS